MALYSCVGLSMAALKRNGGELKTNPICTQRVALSSRVYICVRTQGGGAWNPLRALTQFGTIRQSAKRATDSAKTQRTRQLARQRIQNMRFPSPRSLRSNTPSGCKFTCFYVFLRVYGCIWLCMGVYSCMLLYMAVWLYIAAYGCIRLCMDVLGCICLYVAVYGHIWLYMAIYGCSCLHVAVYG